METKARSESRRERVEKMRADRARGLRFSWPLSSIRSREQRAPGSVKRSDTGSFSDPAPQKKFQAPPLSRLGLDLGEAPHPHREDGIGSGAQKKFGMEARPHTTSDPDPRVRLETEDAPRLRSDPLFHPHI